MKLKFFVIDKLTKDLQKIDIWGNIAFIWPLYWISKTKKNFIFSYFFYILALKYQVNCQNILNIYSMNKNYTIMEQIKPNIVNIYLKSAALPPIQAYLAISKLEKPTIFE